MDGRENQVEARAVLLFPLTASKPWPGRREDLVPDQFRDQDYDKA